MSCRVCGAPLPPKRITYCSMACFNEFKRTKQYHTEQSRVIRSSERYRQAIKNPERMKKLLQYLTKFRTTEEELHRLYHLQRVPVQEIADRYGVSTSAVYRKLKRYGMKPDRVHAYTHDVHRELISKTCDFFKDKFHVIPLHRSIPDIILVNFNRRKIYGVEIIGNKKHRKPAEKKKATLTEKGILDDVFILNSTQVARLLKARTKEEVDAIIGILKRQR